MEIYPVDFSDGYSANGHSIRYSDFIEISQEGPEVGKLTIDGKTIEKNGDYFGRPPFFYENRMFNRGQRRIDID